MIFTLFLKSILYKQFQLITEFMMWIPLRFVRTWYVRLVTIHNGGGHGLLLQRKVRSKALYRVKFGKNVFVNEGALLDGRFGLTIGDNCDIGEYSSIWSETHDTNTHEANGAHTYIGNYCWICPRATIMPGVHIGDGAIVGNGAIVTRDVPDKAIVAGSPARIIGYRKKVEFQTVKHRFLL